MRPVILWFRRDLRLADQKALAEAVTSSAPVIPVYILDDHTPRHRKMGGASRWWLHHSLASLDSDLKKLGSHLILRRGVAAEQITALVRETGAQAVHALHHYEPWWRNAERSLRDQLPDDCLLHLHHGNYLLPPGILKTGGGTSYRIYTPFWRALSQKMPPANPIAFLDEIAGPCEWPTGEHLTDWDLLPKHPNWATGFATIWNPGEAGAQNNLADFLEKVGAYDRQRNMPSAPDTSYLSPHLHFGEISPSQIWHDILNAHDDDIMGVQTYLKEIVWRDYAQNLIYQFPQYGSKNGRSQFDELQWRDCDEPQVSSDFDRWCRGQTGYPIIDAGMRQLWATGWMHNRVRMIAASFLVKHLLIDWRHGEQWFWDTLVDADYASNTSNWQWVAGTGVDANMFVRIMAPLTQSEKFHAGDYIRKWVPELSKLGDPYIHDPDESGCRPKDYPQKIIAHKAGRQRALDAYTAIKMVQS